MECNKCSRKRLDSSVKSLYYRPCNVHQVPAFEPFKPAHLTHRRRRLIRYINLHRDEELPPLAVRLSMNITVITIRMSSPAAVGHVETRRTRRGWSPRFDNEQGFRLGAFSCCVVFAVAVATASALNTRVCRYSTSVV